MATVQAVSNSALIRYPTTRVQPADLDVTLTESVQFDGELKTSAVIVAFTDQPEPAFPIVTP